MLSPSRPNMHLTRKACPHLKAQLHLLRQLQPFLSLPTTQLYRLVWRRLSVLSVVEVSHRDFKMPSTNPSLPSSAIFLVEVQCCIACHAHASRTRSWLTTLSSFLVQTHTKKSQQLPMLRQIALHEWSLKGISILVSGIKAERNL